MQINRITGDECKTTKPLWEEVFYEDSEKFTNYYFENKADKNIGYVIGNYPYDAMMFRTPYCMQIGEEKREISYLVGVATRKEHRHKGYMRALLTKSMEDMYQEKQPFTFLMPANPAIYTPFDFSYVYERDEWKIAIEEACDEGRKKVSEEKNNFMEDTKSIEGFHGIYAVSEMVEKVPQYPIYENLAKFANAILRKKYQIYVHRDASYYEMQLKESLAQNGDIFVLFQEGVIKAFYLYGKEGEEVYIQEVLEEQEGSLRFLQKQDVKKPIIMARIIHAEEMMKLVRDKEEKEIVLQLEDALIEANNGVFKWKLSPFGSSVERLEGGVTADGKITVRELTKHLLKDVFINEIV